MFNILG
jgi:hypothetical protein